MSNLILYIGLTVFNVLGIVVIFFLFKEDKPLGKLYDKCESVVKAFFAYLIFAILLSLFAGRFIYFLCLILLEIS